MTTGELRNLYEDNEHYNKSFQHYGSLVDREGKMKRWCESVFHNDIVPTLNVNMPDGKELRTLGVGSGSGELERHVLKQILQKFPRISHHVVEPSAEMASKYKNLISSSGTELQGVDYHWYPQLLEDFKKEREQSGDETKFNFISAVDSLYYVDDIGKWLDYLYSLLDEGGVLMVVLLADESCLVKMWTEFPGLGNKSKFGFKEYTSADVRAHFNKRQIPYRHFIGEVSGVDMAHAYDPEPTEEADLLVDFVSHTIDFRLNADPVLRDRFMTYLRQCLQPVGDQLVFNTVSGIAIVHKLTK